ncbi:MAG: DNA polymerase III subunit delta [Verrucomicrobia bacterium]|nr:DNA polymerase III subunit delta [Verrucomicrobiota bacterium]MBU4292007.1 DNA polymerase III subunit delta [Verrucomicrobiota bacterium]MBU4427895.1 DNA polymerase III subunit delta [Verrucomicrobiota bacterium]MCG2678841.1 DNA polymerase III subunit delta [Kiritimatiellia bacterium]
MTAAKVSTKTPVYLIHGEDEFTGTTKAKELIRQIIPPEDEILGLEMINARSDTVDEALVFLKQCREAVQTLGFLGNRKVTWLRNANFLDQSIIGKSKEVRARLKDLAEVIQSGLPEGHILVVTTPQVDEKLELYQVCKAAGAVIGYEAAKPWQRDKSAIPFAARLCQELGLTASNDVISALVRKSGTDSRQIQQEIEKLSVYMGDTRTVRIEDIEAVISPSRELFAWNLEDTVANRDLGASLRILRQLLFQKEAPIRLISGLESRFRSLLILREALDKGWIRLSNKFMTKGAITPEQEQLMYQALNDNRLKNPYAAGMRTKQATDFTYAQLDHCRQLILKTRRQLVSSSIPDSWLMDMLIVKICKKPGKAGNKTG